MVIHCAVVTRHVRRGVGVRHLVLLHVDANTTRLIVLLFSPVILRAVVHRTAAALLVSDPVGAVCGFLDSVN